MKRLLDKIVVLPLSLVITFSYTNAQVLTARCNTKIAPNSYGYYEYLPQGYDSAEAKQYPVILFFCGTAEKGPGNENTIYKVLKNGIPKMCNEGSFPASFNVNGEKESFIVITPQFTVDFPTSADINSILDYIIYNYKADPGRIYLTGVSSGGGMVWGFPGISLSNAKRIAAIVPVCAAYILTQAEADNIAEQDIAVWATHNKGDPNVPAAFAKQNVYKINNACATPDPLAKVTIFNVFGHSAWTKTYDVNFRENGLNIYEWMLQYSKKLP